MSNVAEYPQEHPVRFRLSFPVILAFVVTMVLCYLLGQAPTPYYLAESQSIRIDAMSRTNSDAPGSVVEVQQQK